MPTPPFEIPQTIAPSDIDALGHVNNTVYLRWIQEVAVAHWQLIAPSEDQIDFAWIVLRHEIDYKLPALLTDDILLRTWVGAAEGLRFERFTEVLWKLGKAELTVNGREPVEIFRPQRLFGFSMILPDVRAIFGFVDPAQAQAPACGALIRGGATADAVEAGPPPKPAELALR